MFLDVQACGEQQMHFIIGFLFRFVQPTQSFCLYYSTVCSLNILCIIAIVFQCWIVGKKPVPDIHCQKHKRSFKKCMHRIIK